MYFFKTPRKDVIHGAGNTFKRAGGCFKIALAALHKGKKNDAQHKQINQGNDPHRPE